MTRHFLYTDASSGPCAGSGGFAVVSGSDVLVMGSETGYTTITRLEGLAVVSAMRLSHTLFSQLRVTILTDAQVWVNRFNYLPDLRRRGWRRSTGKLVKEVDIMEAMWDFYCPDRVQVRWVRGHSWVAGNVFADKVAGEAKEFAHSLVFC